MATTSTTAFVRSVLNGDVSVPADEVIRQARAVGLTASDASLRDAVYSVKSDLRTATKAKAKAAPKPAPAAARTTKSEAPAPAVEAAPAPAVSSPGLDLSAVLANVALVNAVMAQCGGAEQARKVAEAVTACGGVEAFLQHLELVAGIRGGAPA